MIVTPKYKYFAFGLNILSDIPIRQFISCDFKKEHVRIQMAKNPDNLEIIKSMGHLFQSNDSEFLLKINKLCSIYIRNGELITIHQFNNGLDISDFLIGIALGALLNQRGKLTLHGSAVRFKNKGLAFLGESQSGKSTIAGSLIMNGAFHISDDITTIDISSHVPYMTPSYPFLKLWSDNIKKLTAFRPQKELSFERNKYFVQTMKFENKPCKIDYIFVIHRILTKTIKTVNVSGFEKFKAIIQNTYMPRSNNHTIHEKRSFDMIIDFLPHVHVIQIAIPENELNLAKINKVITRSIDAR